MEYHAKNFARILLFIVGCISVYMSILVSSENYEQLLVGVGGRDLSWGPNLFRLLLLFHGALLLALSLGWERVTKKAAFPVKDSDSSQLKVNWRDIGLLSLLSLVAIPLRLININSDLWVDEVFTLVDFVRLPIGQILTSFPSQNQHMLYSVLARLSFDLFGESAFALRLPSVLFGVGSIWALYYLAKRVLGGREALFASVLMTVSYHHIWFSQNARGYTGLLFFTLLATWMWLEALDKNKSYLWILYSAAVVLGMWIHMTMAFVVATHGLIYLVFLLKPSFSGEENFADSPERRAGFRPLISWFLSVTVTLQLYAMALPEFLSVGLHEESKNSVWTNPIWVIKEVLQNLSIGFAGLAVVLFGGAFLAFGWISLFNRNRRAAILIVLPPILAGTFMFLLGHNMFPRFFFFAMGFAILVVIHGLSQLPQVLASKFGNVRFNRLSGAMSTVLVMIMIGASVLTIPRNYNLPKQDFSGAKAYVESHRQPGEKVVAVSLAGSMYRNYFAPEWDKAENDEELKNIEKSQSGIWLVYTLSPEIKAFHPQMWDKIVRDYEVIKVFPGTLNGGEVFICRKREDIGNRS